MRPWLLLAAATMATPLEPDDAVVHTSHVQEARAIGAQRLRESVAAQRRRDEEIIREGLPIALSAS